MHIPKAGIFDNLYPSDILKSVMLANRQWRKGVEVEVQAAETFKIDDDDMQVFFSKHAVKGALPQLTVLDLSYNQIGDAGVTALANACAMGALAQLGILYLVGNSVSGTTQGIMKTAMSKSGGSVYF